MRNTKRESIGMRILTSDVSHWTSLMPRNKKLQRALSYRRVSTDKQGDHGIGLDLQHVAIKKFAEVSGMEIVEDYYDVGTGLGPESISARSGLQRAIDHAKREGLTILVQDFSRFSRDEQSAVQIIRQERLRVIEVLSGNRLDGVVLESVAARAEANGRLIGERTKKALAVKKMQGVKLGNRTNLDVAQKLGADANHKRRVDKVSEIAGALKGREDWTVMNAQDVVDLLNSLSIQTGRGNRWTLSTIRRPLSDAKSLIIEQRKMALAGDFADDPRFGAF